MHTREYDSAIELKEILPFETESHYAEWNKPGGERQTLYDVTYMWHLKNVELKGDRLEWWWHGARGRGEGAWSVKGNTILVVRGVSSEVLTSGDYS